MSMHTIFILMKNGEVLAIAPGLTPDGALEFFNEGQGWNRQTGQVFACHMSETAADEVWTAFYDKPSIGKPTAATLVKRYSSYMNHVSDVT